MKRSQRFLLTLIPAVCLPVYLTVFQAEPGQLALAHARQPTLHEGLDRCAECHTPQGLDPGCLGCHEEIAAGLERERGYHSYLLQAADPPSCASCHSDHRGREFRPLNSNSWPEGRNGFQHPHLDEFLLDAGRHREVMQQCEDCHNRKLVDALPSPDAALIRCEETYLGLDSDCLRCHQNPHGEAISTDCLTCHDQSQWEEVVGFDHEQVFALDGGHRELRCDQCHTPDENDPVGKTKGEACSDCHQDPHPERPFQASFTQEGQACTRCHDSGSFAEQTLRYPKQDHSPQSFPLVGRHLDASCRVCHARPEDAFAVFATLNLPTALSEVRREECARCHGDVHADTTSGIVQLEVTDGCQACHDEQGWKPALWQRDDHAKTGFALSGAHARVDCVRCHTGSEPLRPQGAPVRSCSTCHEEKNPHRAAFTQGCGSCHGTERLDWLDAKFTVDQHDLTGFTLDEPHRLECAKCHDPQQEFAQRYRSISPSDCRGCHEDPHLAQFDVADTPAGCRDCHQDLRWSPSTFGAERHAKAGYPLEDGHAAAACTSCHRRRRRRVGEEIVTYRRFRGQSRACKSCHENPHGAQFASQLSGQGDCSRCHQGERSWRIPRFDHDVTRFPLGASHQDTSCAGCHVPSDRPSEGRVYRPLDPSCAACHADPHGGQFQLDQPQVANAGRCERCHTEDLASWKLEAFDHDATRYPLDGAHQDVACAACHRPYRLTDGRTIVRFRPLGTACKDCHGSFRTRE